MGVEIATATPGLYPVFGADNQPDLSGFSVQATPATGQPTLDGVTEPQPACAPGTSLAANPAPNLYCETDTDDNFEFPMAANPTTFDFSMATTPVSYVHDPDQAYPQEVSQGSCLGQPPGIDAACELEAGAPPNTSDITWFDYIGIYRELKVTTETTSGTLLPGVTVSLNCSAPASDPSYACPQPGEKSNLDTGAGGTANAPAVRAHASTSSTSTTTGSNGTGSFSGIYLPGTTVSLSALPPAGYQAASLVATVASPVSTSTTTGAAISQAAQTPIDLILVFSAQAAPTTTTVPPTTTTVPAAAAAAPASHAPPAALPLTGFDSELAAGAAALLMAAGSGLLLAGRWRRARRGAHVLRR